MNFAVTNFTSGELTERIENRSDTEKYQSGCKYLRNMIPQIYGGAERRPGTQFVAVANAEISRLIPFVYSSDIAYVVEITDKAMRFIYDGELLDGADITTPFEEANIFALHFRQIADVMRQTNANYRPYKLSRTGATEFTLEEIDFRKGPFLTRNDLVDPVNPSTTTMTCSVTVVGSYGTLKASLGIFQDGHKGALFKLTHKRTTTKIKLDGNAGEQTSAELDVKGTFQLVGFIPENGGTYIIQREENNSGTWSDYRTYDALKAANREDTVTFTEKEDNVKYRIYTANGAADMTVTLNAHDPDKSGIVRVLSVVDSKNAVIEVLSTLELTTATTRWYEGAWSNVRGWPATITFFGDRAIYAGALSGSGASNDQLIDDYPSLRNLDL
ncbi:MAG: hypothetical protein IMZ61_06545 [Planctomycetes bacterium]|nr:hypothetical protein [Planctomycetota bacterium]